MNALLICPEHRATAGAFSRQQPLALLPLLGRSLLDRRLSQLATDGCARVLILSSDRPELVRKAVGQGEAWGLSVEVIATATELTVGEAATTFAPHFADGPPPHTEALYLPDTHLWDSAQSFYQTLSHTLQHHAQSPTLTMAQISPGVWVSTKAHISPSAELLAPAWIGPHVTLKAGCYIGPGSIVEAGAFIDSDARIENSWIGPATYVGKETLIRESYAWGNGLLCHSTSSFIEVQDSFLLHDISRPISVRRCTTWLGRLTALLLLIGFAPIAFAVSLPSILSRKSLLRERRVVLPPFARLDSFSRTFPLWTLSGTSRLIARWPQLWHVVRGEMALVGNRPLTLESATALRGEIGLLWLAGPAGVFSLADAEDAQSLTDSIAHAAYFSTHPTRTLRTRILLRCLSRLFRPSAQSII